MPSLLTKDEKLAVIDWVEDFDQHGFAAYLVGRAGSARLATFASLQSPMPAIAVAFVGWLEGTPDAIVTVLQAALVTHPRHPSAAQFRRTLDRFEAARTKQDRTPVPPWEATLVAGIPIANRSPLRKALRNMMSRDLPAVVMVNGERGLGHTHSWYLIQHVARSANVAVVKIDLTAPVFELGTIEELCSFLTDKLRISTCRATTSGATVETIAARYADAMSSELGRLAEANQVWLVFDNLHRTAAPEVKRFIYTLAEMRLKGEMPNCRVFLLGIDQTYGVDDPFRLSELENLTTLLPDEVADAAAEINRLGNESLDEAALAAWIADLQGELLPLRGPPAIALVARKLVDLRAMVGA